MTTTNKQLKFTEGDRYISSGKNGKKINSDIQQTSRRRKHSSDKETNILARENRI